MGDISRTARGIDKFKRYNWGVQDKAGVLAQVSKHDIVFEDKYQRELNETKVLAMARDWSWLAMGVITLADRGGKLYAVDGMHRVSAALRRSDIQELPCIIFKTSSVKQEAKGFIQANTLRKAVGTADKHRALVLAEDDIALMVQRLLDNSPFLPSANGKRVNSVKCFGVLHSLAKKKPEYLAKVWPLVCEICEGRHVNERILQALVLLAERGTEDITKGKWRAKLIALGFDGIKRAAEEAAAYYARGGARVWADGIVKEMNRGMRNRLEVTDGS